MTEVETELKKVIAKVEQEKRGRLVQGISQRGSGLSLIESG
jgi:hypothetical protein